MRQYLGNTTAQVLSFVFYLYPVWLPVLLTIVFWDMWVHYVRNHYFNSIKYTLLEIKLPIEISKSPHAMEVIIDSFWQIGGETTFFDRYWTGKTRPYYSLELVSIEGNVHFFVWTRDSEKDLIESRIYSQYPGVEVYEVPDYTAGIEYDESKNKMFACVFKLVDSNSALPIKVYSDFGLDKDPKEEFKIDPLTPILEFLGSLGPGEQAWYQIVIHTHKIGADRPKDNVWFDFGFDFEKSPIGFYFDASKASLFQKTDWKEAELKAIKKIRESLVDLDHPDRFPRIMTKGEMEKIAAMEHTVAKPAFNTGIRALYIADKDKYQAGRRNDLYGAYRHYNSIYNGIKPVPTYTGYDSPWNDFMGMGERKKKKYALQAYKKRGFFFTPYNEKDVFVMNGEELASLFHFPGAVATTPTLNRIPSKKSEAPSNLPI
ncbi:TPA: hypothetical protein DCQ44_00800 [Candidatus Taylorbacteria bacterium]|nr:hypothetical protein [Candidatus Taylorbacteria bacterium]